MRWTIINWTPVELAIIGISALMAGSVIDWWDPDESDEKLQTEIKMRISGGEWSTNWEILFSVLSMRNIYGDDKESYCFQFLFIPKYFPFSISSGAILQSTAQRICQNHILVSMFAHLQSDEEDTRLIKLFFFLTTNRVNKAG